MIAVEWTVPEARVQPAAAASHATRPGDGRGRIRRGHIPGWLRIGGRVVRRRPGLPSEGVARRRWLDRGEVVDAMVFAVVTLAVVAAVVGATLGKL